MSNSLIHIGLTGLKAHQSALSVTGNNITNANTDGYSRQRVNLEASLSVQTAGGYLGTGVNLINIERLNSHFINTQLRLDTSHYHHYNSLNTYLGQVDKLLGNSSTGLSTSLSNFFSALHMVADDPTSIPARSTVVGEAQALTTRFHTLYNQLNQIGRSVDQEITSIVPQINSLSQSIAELNVAIVSAGGGTSRQQPNDLLDQRDEKIRQLAELVAVNVVDAGDGTVSLFIGKGQSLVVGNRANTLSVDQSASDPARRDIFIEQNGQKSLITSEVTGGKLGGVLAFRDTALRDSINSLGRIALNIAEAVNEQHRLGVDLRGNPGLDFFRDLSTSATVSANEKNQGNGKVTVQVSDAQALTTEDYELRFLDSDRYEITTAAGVLVGSGQVPDDLQLAGMTIQFPEGGFQTGDRFLITPTRHAAQEISVSVTEPEALALSFPLRTASGEKNTGTATMTQGELYGGDTSGMHLVDPATPLPVRISFTQATPNDPLTYTIEGVAGTFTHEPGKQIELFIPGESGDKGYRFTISGTPKTGDEFTIEAMDPTAMGISDNRNALALTALESASLVEGSLSFAGAYTYTVQTVATATSQARISTETAHSLMQQSEASWQSLSGVNLDEEAGKLIQFQSAYNASAQVVSIARELFNTLISVF